MEASRRPRRHSVPRLVDVPGEDDVPVVADGDDRRLVDEVRQVRAREPRGGPGHVVEVDVGREMLARDVDLQDGGTFRLVGEGNLDLAVEAARSQQCRVEDLGPVGGGHHHDAGGGVEAVHLGQELIEGLLAFVVGHDRAAPALADGVDLVDEDDRGGALAGIGEEVADPRCPDPHEELDEARPGEGQEGHPGLTGHRSGHEGLAGSRWAHHQHPARADGTGAGVALGMAQEVHHLGHLTLCSLVPGDVGEPGRRPFLVVDLGLRASEAHDPPGERLRAPPSHPDEEREQQQEGDEGQDVLEEGRARSDAGDVDIVGLQGGGELGVGDGRRDLAGVVVTVLQRAGDGAAGVDRCRAHVPRFDLGDELRVAEVLRRCGRHVKDRQQGQRDHHAERQEPYSPPWRGRGCGCGRAVVRLARLGGPCEVADSLHHAVISVH